MYPFVTVLTHLVPITLESTKSVGCENESQATKLGAFSKTCLTLSSGAVSPVVWLGRVTSVSLGLGFPIRTQEVNQNVHSDAGLSSGVHVFVSSCRKAGNGLAFGSIWEQACLLKTIIIRGPHCRSGNLLTVLWFSDSNCSLPPWWPWMAEWHSWGWLARSQPQRSRVGFGRCTSRSLEFWVPVLLVLLTTWHLLKGLPRSDSLVGLRVIRAMRRHSTLPQGTCLCSEWSQRLSHGVLCVTLLDT